MAPFAAAPLLMVAALSLAPVFISGAAAQSPVKLAQQSDNPFSALVGKRSDRVSEYGPARAVERYVLASDDRIFLFEERGATARVRFLCSSQDPRLDCVLDSAGPAPEIHSLSATRGPRGDVIYKTDEGETLLRIAAYGGATVFWPGEDHGIAASKSFGDDHPLTLVFEDYETAARRAQGASAQLSAIIGSPIFFDVSAGRRTVGDNAAVLSDAVLTAAKGLAMVADDATGARVIAGRIRRVAFLPGAAPGVALDGSALEIIYVPNGDITGRPSSAKVARYLEETL
ncbi:DUF4908 domain-containing protein [Hyphococcus sp.]|uniref:DUF4908 domain-containing protein n=1 Tax=Hyphococcus sp. TaxID=2038636 RepID=UPI003D0B9699